MENIYQTINRFNSMFGHEAKIIPSMVADMHLYIQLNYNIPIDLEKVNKQTTWTDRDDTKWMLPGRNYAMAKIWIKCDKENPSVRPSFVLWYDNIYVNPYVMPDHELAQKFYEARKTFAGCLAGVLCNQTEVFLSDRMLDKFIRLCHERMRRAQKIIEMTKDINDLYDYTGRVRDSIDMLRALELEKQYRKEKCSDGTPLS